MEPATGRATLTVRWPERASGRLIPVAANAIRVTVTSATDGAIHTTLLPRPEGGGVSSVTLDGLPLGDAVASAAAHPNADGSGVAQAKASARVAIAPGQNTPLALTLSSDIDRIEVNPASPSPVVGQTLTLSATAKNAAGEVVLTSGAWQWRSDGEAVATVSADGTLTGVAAGVANISATDTESGKSGSAAVTVRPVGNPGDLLIYDGFDYAAGSRMENQNGGTGWARGWNEYGQGYTPSTITDAGLTYKNLKTSGRAVQTTSLWPIGHARVPAQQVGVDGTVLYFSALLRPLTTSGGWPDSYFGIGLSDMLIGKPGRNGFYSIAKPNENIVSTGVPVNANETVFLVYRVTFQPGNDRTEMWVNPTPGQSLPAPMAVKTDVNVSLPGDLGIGSSVRVVFDEYRVGKTWESVSPTAP